MAAKPTTVADMDDGYVYAVRYRSRLGLGDYYELAATEATARRKVRGHRGAGSTATAVRAPRGEWEEVGDA